MSNIIETCIQKNLDPASFTKFQQVLEYISDYGHADEALYGHYNNVLLAQLKSIPEGLPSEQYISLKVKFYSFRFMTQVAKVVLRKLESGEDKADNYYTSLAKILLYHALSAKNDTANLALVELEQLCVIRGITLQTLFARSRTKFMRLIIKAILNKLTSSKNSFGKSNCVITYMTRALEIFNVATIRTNDVAQSLIIVTNMIHKANYNGAIKLFLEYLAAHQGKSVYSLVNMHIQTIVVDLLLRRKLSIFDIEASLEKLCSFCDKSLKELLENKLTFIKGRLLLDYSTKRKIVTGSVEFLCKFEKEKPFEDEFDDENLFLEHLIPSMIGILLGIDSYFTSTQEHFGSEESIKHIESLCKLISSLGQNEIQTIHVKVLSTLSLLLRLRLRRDNQTLNKTLKNIWAVFVSKLSEDLKNSLLINISVALYDLLEDCPEEVASIYEDLICRDNPRLQSRLKSLFFIPNLPSMQKVYNFLTPHVRRQDSVKSLQELQQSLDCVLPLMKYENQKCRLVAITKIRQLLQSNQNLLCATMLVNQDEPLESLLSKTIQSLLALSSFQDPECSTLIAECLGILGAVNPVRLDHLIYGEITENEAHNVIDIADREFIIELVERLKSSLFSDQRSESECANYALQVVVKSYTIFDNPNIKDKLSDEALRACYLSKNTSYSGFKKSQPDTLLPVFERFKHENSYSYKEWLDKFCMNVISCIKDATVQEVLNACSYIFRYNPKLAEYLLPLAIIHVIINQPAQILIIKREFLSIIEEDVGVSTQDLDNVYTDDLRGSIQTLHFQCANMMFCILDALNSLDSRVKRKVVNLSYRQAEAICDFLQAMPKDKLGHLASKCRLHARALCYFEQFLFDKKQRLDDYITALQTIYVALDDTYEAAGIEMIRTSPSTIAEEIANYKACGRFDKAFIYCLTTLDTMDYDSNRKPYIEDALRCLSYQGDYLRLYEKSQQFLGEYVQFKRTILPYAIEASWKLGKWDELNSISRTEQVDNLLESTSVSQGYLLMSLVGSTNNVDDRLNLVRQRLMKPLSIAMMDGSAYFRGYQNLLNLHCIGDFSLYVDFLKAINLDGKHLDENSIDDVRETLNKSLNFLFDMWNNRNKLVEPSLRSLEPLLVWQRTLSIIMGKKFPFLSDRINVDVGRMWLISADSAREARSFDRSFYCLTQAKRWFGSEFDKLCLDLRVKYHIQQAKLNWDQGEQTKAIRCLKVSLDRLKYHGLYQHLKTRKEKSQSADTFPELNNLRSCRECSEFDQSDRKSFAEMKMLLTQYCEEGAAGIPETLFFMYEECVHLGVNQEETYFRLARYYDKLRVYYMDNPQLCTEQVEEKNQLDATQRFSQNLMGGDKEEVYTKLMEHSIIAFGNSLRYGVRFLRESMPRLLNIWYELGKKKVRTSINNSVPPTSRSVSSRTESTVRFIDELKSKHLPPYYFMTAISLLLSQVCHPHSGVAKKTHEILELLLMNYPHQISWQMMAMMNETHNEERKKAARAILSFKKRGPKIDQVIRDTTDFTKLLAELAELHGPYDPRSELKKKRLGTSCHIKEISPNSVKYDFSKIRVIAPLQKSFRPILPMDNHSEAINKHVVFPEQNISYIREIDPMVRIFNSLQQPRAIWLKLDNGQKARILCKAGDDLRKDSRCIEFLNLLNGILRRDSQSNARFFDIQTFLVLPLKARVGIIEMVPDCESVKEVLEPLYKDRKPPINQLAEVVPKKTRELTNEEKLCLYKKNVAKFSPPMLPVWLLRQFTEPTSWYMARLAFVRSSAVAAMGGYIIGLGDRHLDNILIDKKNGRLIHVDFNLLFHQGDTLQVPERVPFRLSPNFVACFGSMGTEGNFRKVCEITMGVMRKEKEALITTLIPLMQDPCSDWIKVRQVAPRSDVDEKHENISAKFRIEVTERKLKGYPRSKSYKPLRLIDSYSVEAQVDNLINEATDDFNLSNMYFGWCAHV